MPQATYYVALSFVAADHGIACEDSDPRGGCASAIIQAQPDVPIRRIAWRRAQVYATPPHQASSFRASGSSSSVPTLIVGILAMMAVVMAIVAVTMVIVMMITIDSHHGAVITVVVMLIVHGGTVMMVSIVMIVIHTDADAPWPNIQVLGKRGGWSCDRKTKNQGEWRKVFHF